MFERANVMGGYGKEEGSEEWTYTLLVLGNAFNSSLNSLSSSLVPYLTHGSRESASYSSSRLITSSYSPMGGRLSMGT
jgi:hypothetical protein